MCVVFFKLEKHFLCNMVDATYFKSSIPSHSWESLWKTNFNDENKTAVNFLFSFNASLTFVIFQF